MERNESLKEKYILDSVSFSSHIKKVKSILWKLMNLIKIFDDDQIL